MYIAELFISLYFLSSTCSGNVRSGRNVIDRDLPAVPEVTSNPMSVTNLLSSIYEECPVSTKIIHHHLSLIMPNTASYRHTNSKTPTLMVGNKYESGLYININNIIVHSYPPYRQARGLKLGLCGLRFL